jgi:hypothetical protein
MIGAALVLAPCAARASTDTLPCEGRQTGFGSGELACKVDTRGGSQARRFEAEFSGVHDDSQAAMAASLDGTPLACSPGGQERLEGETQGNRLSCGLVIPAGGAEHERTVLLRLRWHHAEPARFTFLPDTPR